MSFKKETKVEKVEKGVPKKSTKKVKNVKKTNFKKALALIGLWILEVLVCGVIVITSWCLNTIEAYIGVFDVVHEQQQLIEDLVNEVTEIRVQPQAVKTVAVEDDRTYLGNFKITHYCACTKCCGKNAQGITASGKRVEENKTIAVDPKVIALGSEVYIDGYGYMEAQDTGSAIKGNIIDVYIADHEEALNLGVVYKDVYLVK
jgi:3D (Asp-Asp-Asp) domain-containing protein